MHKTKVIPICMAIGLVSSGCLQASAGTPANIANRCKSITAFPNVAFNPPERLIDGQNDTYWYSEPKAPVNWVEIDFGKAVHLGRMLLKGVDHSEVTDALFTIQAWSGKNWTTLFKGPYPEGHFFTFSGVKANKLRLEIGGITEKVEIAEWEIYPTVENPVYCNQIGYLSDGPKRFTVLDVPDGTRFKVIHSTNWEVAYKGIVVNKVGDFTDWEPTIPGTYMVELNSDTESRSFPFEVEPFLYERIAYPAALKFMVDSRTNWGDKGNCVDSGPNCKQIKSGHGWRGSDQTSLDIASLIAIFLSNPSGTTNLPSDPIHFYESASNTPETDLPELIKLIHWGVHILLESDNLSPDQYHQLAWFAWSWPWLPNCFDHETYLRARNRLLSYYYPTFASLEIDFPAGQIANVSSTGKNVTGSSLLSQLFMWDVCKRDNLSESIYFLENSEKQLTRLLSKIEKTNLETVAGGQTAEMELLDIPAIAMYMRYFPDQAHVIRPQIEDWARIVIAHSDPSWDIVEPGRHGSSPGGSNYFFSLPASALSAASVLHDRQLKTDLKRLAMGHFDHVFGRNVFGRHFSYHAISDFKGADLGWFTQSIEDPDLLNNTRGLLDGEPIICSTGLEAQHASYLTESSLEKQIAWNFGLAYLGWANTSVFATFSTYDKLECLIRWTDTLYVQLKAPININSNLVEQATVTITTDRGDKETIILNEITPDNDTLRNEIQITRVKKIYPNDGKIQARKGDLITVSYGGAGFQNSYTLIMGR